MALFSKKVFHFTKSIVRDFQPDRIAAYTASVCWFIMLSFFPFMIVLLSLVRFLPFLQTDTVSLDIRFIPITIRDLLESILTEVTQNTSAAVLPIGAVTGLFSASTGFDSLIRGLNVIYKRQETRPFWYVRLLCMLYTLVFLFIILAVLMLVVFGKPLYAVLLKIFSHLPSGIARMIDLRFLAIICILTVFFTLLYKTIPKRKTKWFGEIPGAFLASCSWMTFSHLYSLYIVNFNRFSMIYGSLTLIILLMIWMYTCIYLVFIGAFINTLLQKTTFGKVLMRQKGDRS